MTGFIFIVDMARSVIKVDKLYKLSTSKTVSSEALQVGCKKLKHTQNEVVKEFVSGRDVFVSLPTGSGKSLCYAVLPVRSPLHTTLQYEFEAGDVARFLAHNHGCLYVRTYHTQGHTQNYVIHQNSTIIAFHCETEACSESPDPSSSLPFHYAH